MSLMASVGLRSAGPIHLTVAPAAVAAAMAPAASFWPSGERWRVSIAIVMPLAYWPVGPPVMVVAPEAPAAEGGAEAAPEVAAGAAAEAAEDAAAAPDVAAAAAAEVATTAPDVAAVAPDLLLLPQATVRTATLASAVP